MIDHAQRRLLADLAKQRSDRINADAESGDPIVAFLERYDIHGDSLREWAAMSVQATMQHYTVQLLTAADFDRALLINRSADTVSGFMAGYEFALHQNDPPLPAGATALPGTAMTAQLILAARGLRSEDGKNAQYDRALVDLVAEVLGLNKVTAANKVLDD